MTEMGICTTWLRMEAARATTLTGVTPVKAASAAVVVRTQPHPVPDTTATTSMVLSAMSPAAAVWARRRRVGAAGPAHTHPRKSTPSAAGDFTPAASAQRITPGTVPKRLATANPAMRRPIMRASLWSPARSDSSTRGDPAPKRIGMGRVTFEGSGQRGGGGHHERDARQLEQAQQDEVGQDLVPGRLVEHAVGRQEGRAVGRLGVRPDGVRHFVERRRAEHARCRSRRG